MFYPMMDTKVTNKYAKELKKSTLFVILFYFSEYLLENNSMKQQLNRKLVVRISESQYNILQENILQDQKTMSQVIRESLRNKLNNIYQDDKKKRKFRL